MSGSLKVISRLLVRRPFLSLRRSCTRMRAHNTSSKQKEGGGGSARRCNVLGGDWGRVSRTPYSTRRRYSRLFARRRSRALTRAEKERKNEKGKKKKRTLFTILLSPSPLTERCFIYKSNSAPEINVFHLFWTKYIPFNSMSNVISFIVILHETRREPPTDNSGMIFNEYRII